MNSGAQDESSAVSSAAAASLTRRRFLQAAGAAGRAIAQQTGAREPGLGFKSHHHRGDRLGHDGPGEYEGIFRGGRIARWWRHAIWTPRPPAGRGRYRQQHYGNKDCKAYHDYREIAGAADDIDAVMIAIPDQWHAIAGDRSCESKKDIYGEKPLARTVSEQQAIVRAVEQNNVIWQTGSWQRSVASFHKAAEIVRNGLIGDGDARRGRIAGRSP